MCKSGKHCLDSGATTRVSARLLMCTVSHHRHRHRHHYHPCYFCCYCHCHYHNNFHHTCIKIIFFLGCPIQRAQKGQQSRKVLEPTQPHIQRVPGDLLPGVMQLGHNADHNNVWIYTSTPPYTFMA
jgi:hypothetical protein